MKFFVGTHRNKVDRKGRVSIPAAFRTVLGVESSFYAFPSFAHDGVECKTEAFMEMLSERVDSLDLFSDEQDTLAEQTFARSHLMTFDREGRVVIPKEILDHAGIDGEVIFVGKGKAFQIWEPAAHEAYQKATRERAPADRQALRRRPRADNLGRVGPVESGT